MLHGPTCMTLSRVLLIDRDAASASVLVDELRRHGVPEVAQAQADAGLPLALRRCEPDAVLLHYHASHPSDLLGCCAARLASPGIGIAVIAAAGACARAVESWADGAGLVDVVIEEPLLEDSLPAAMRHVAGRRDAPRALDARHIAQLLPDGALAALEGGRALHEELFEAAVLFTDIRGSSDLVTRTAPHDFFAMLNRCLSAQAAQVRTCGGAVVKYTGDGLMAVFRGPQRAPMALRCALAMARSEAQREMPFGIGVAQGQVLAGLVGDSAEAGAQRQYDVIGATVHLAARLCDLASAAEVVATRDVHAKAAVAGPAQGSVDLVMVPGFDGAIECVTLQRE
jgi:adenylate cyclase